MGSIVHKLFAKRVVELAVRVMSQFVCGIPQRVDSRGAFLLVRVRKPSHAQYLGSVDAVEHRFLVTYAQEWESHQVMFGNYGLILVVFRVLA